VRLLHPPQPSFPLAFETFGGLGPGRAELRQGPPTSSLARRLPYIDSDDYDVARVGQYYTQRLVVQSPPRTSAPLRRKAVWESQASDMSLLADCQHAAALVRRRDGVLGAADAVYVSMPRSVQGVLSTTMHALLVAYSFTLRNDSSSILGVLLLDGIVLPLQGYTSSSDILSERMYTYP